MSSKKIQNNLVDVKKEVYNEMYIKMNQLAEAIATDIESHYEQFVDMWYASYTPKKYQRTFDTYYGSSAFNGGFLSPARNIEDHYKVIKTDDGFDIDVGIVVSHEFLHDYYDDPASYVFPRSWEQGIHGTIATGGKTEPPKDMMDKWFSSISGDNLYRYVRDFNIL